MKQTKFLTKLISAATSAAVTLSALSAGFVTASAEVLAPQDMPPAEGEIVRFIDFESAKTFGGNYCDQYDTETELHGKALKKVPSEGGVYDSYSFSADDQTAMASGEAYVLSFDFKAAQTDHTLQMIFRDAHDGVYSDISGLYLDHNGKVVVAQNGQTPYNLRKGATYDGSLGFKEIGYYDAENWHNVAVMVMPNQGGRTVKFKWYYDGVFAMDADTSNVNIEGLKNARGIINNIYIGSNWKGFGLASGETLTYDGTEEFYFDNFTVSTYPKDKFYAVAEGGDSKIKVNFTEGVAAGSNLKNAVVRNTETGETVGIKDAQSDTSGAILITEKALSSSTEYRVEFDSNLKSGMDRALATEVYFVTPGATTIEKDKLVSDGSSIKYENKNTTFEFNLPTYTGSDNATYILEMDLTITNPTANAVKFYPRSSSGMLASSKTADNKGTVSTLKGKVAWLDDADALNASYNVAENAFPSGVKRKLTYQIDSEKRAVHMYADNDYMGTRTLNDNESTNSLRPTNLYIGIDKNKSENISVTLENVNVYTAKSTNKPNKFRVFNRNGAECEPYTDKALSNAKKARLYFNCSADSASLTADNIVIKDASGNTAPYTIGDYNSTDKYVDINFNEFLNKGETYTVDVSNITSSGAAIGGYSTKFTVNEDDDFYISNMKFVNGSELLEPAFANGQVYLNADIVNSTDSDKNVKAVLFAEKDGVIKDFKTVDVTALANADTMVSETENTNFVTVNGGVADYIKAVFVDGDSGIPYSNEISIGERTPATDTNKDVYYNKFEKTYEGKGGVKYFARIYLAADKATATEDTVGYFSGTADENGKIELDFRVATDDLSGKYTVSGMFADGTAIAETLNVSNPDEAENLTNEITNNIKTQDKDTAKTVIKEVIEDRVYAMSIDVEDTDKIDTAAASEIVYNEIKALGSDPTVEQTKFILNKAVYIEAIREGKVDNIYDAEEQLALEDTRINQFKEYSFNTESFRKSVTNGINKSYSIKSFEDFEDALYEQFVLKTVKSPDGTENLKKVMNEFNSEIGVSKDMEAKVYVAVKNNTYANYAELKSAAVKAMNSSSSGTGGGGGGSFGGGGSSGIRDVTVSSDLADPGIAEEINKNVFDDIDGVAWAKEAIVYLAEKKIINGVGKGKFAPDDNVTRAEMAKMISGAFLTKAEAGENPFNDVSEDDWSCEYIKKAYAAGIITGYEDGSFRPDDVITRQDAAVMLYRAAKYFNIDFYAEIANYFMDEAEFADYAVEAINGMYNMGFINGVGDGMFAPNDMTTRAQTAKIIYGMLQM